MVRINSTNTLSEMKKLILSMHVSVDGHVAGSKEETDWIHMDEEIFSYGAKITEEADTAVHGRVAFLTVFLPITPGNAKNIC